MILKSEVKNCKMCRERVEAGVVEVFPKSVICQAIPLWSSRLIISLDLGDKCLKQVQNFLPLLFFMFFLCACPSFLLF